MAVTSFQLILLVTIVAPPAPNASGSWFKTCKELVLLWNQFSWPSAGSLAVEAQRTGSFTLAQTLLQCAGTLSRYMKPSIVWLVAITLVATQTSYTSKAELRFTDSIITSANTVTDSGCLVLKLAWYAFIYLNPIQSWLRSHFTDNVVTGYLKG